MAELIGMKYSPWTEKARRALDHHKIPYKYNEHLVLFGMPALRWKMRMFGEGPTVPAYIDGRTRLNDSYVIAQYADKIGAGSKLFPPGSEAKIAECNAISERGLDAGRAIMMRRMAGSREAQFEGLPPPLRFKIFLPLVPVALSYIAAEFGAKQKSVEEHQRELRSTLLAARQAVKDGGGSYVTGSFSFADIALAVLVQFVRPVSDEFVPLGPATRRVWGDPALEKEFGDLVQWRDRIYSQFQKT